MGKQTGKLVGVQLVNIHGARFWDLTFVLDASPGQNRFSRLGTESVYDNPQPGDAVRLSLVLGQLTRVERAENGSRIASHET